MKSFIVLLSFVFSLSANAAIDPAVFKENYPGFQNYHSLLFSKLSDYFETLALNSMIYTDQSGIRTFKIRNKNGEDFTTITAKITREVSTSEINEHVLFYLENGNSISYDIKKIGAKVIPTDDEDLLKFRFKPSPNEEVYQVNIPFFKVQVGHSKLANDEKKSFFYLGFMEFNVQLESHFSEHDASLSYIYFFKGMPNPQSSLTVRAIETDSDWSGVKLIHLGSNAGEITPKQFFKGLGDGAGAFSEAAEIMKSVLGHIGFPKLD